jgi:hypothetical protein
MKLPNKDTSSRTQTRTFRITNTQYNLLNTAPHKTRASAIVRVLLALYFNKKIPNIDLLIKAEESDIQTAKEKNLLNFREMLKNQGKEKRANGTNSSSI